MKKITNALTFMLFLMVAFNSAAQERGIDELIQSYEINKNSPNSFTQFFSIEEMSQLNAYLRSQTTQEVSVENFGGGILAYGWESQANGYGSYDTSSPNTYTNISTGAPIGPDDFEGAGSISPDNNTTGIVADNVGNLYSLEVLTGTYTVLGNTGLVDGGFTGLAHDPSDAVLYAVDANNLYIVDPVAASATLVGSLGLPGDGGTNPTGVAIALAIDNAGVGYTYDIVLDIAYSIDLSTGTTTALGQIGFDAAFGQGMFYDAGIDQVYLAAFNGTGNLSELRTLDTTTGATTLVGEISPGAVTQVAWSSVRNSPTDNFTCEDANSIGLGVTNSIGPSNTSAGASNVCLAGATDAVWYSYTASNSGMLTVSSDLTTNTGQDTRVSVYNNDCANLSCLASDDNSGQDGLSSTVTFMVESGMTYLIEWDDASDGANFDFELSLSIACPDPENFTLVAATDNSADFSWDAVAEATNGYVLNVFESGADPDTAMSVYSENVPSGTTTATATGLMETTVYDAYLTADCDTNGLSNRSTALSFETLIAPPVCGGKFYDTGGPDGTYQANEDYSLLISPDVAGNVVYLDFLSVDIEATFDFLRVYDGMDASAPELSDPTNGVQEPGLFIATNPDGVLFVTFTSDISIQEAGWDADVICAAPPTCDTPENLMVGEVTVTTADFSWDPVANAASGYIISVFNQNDDPETAMPVYTENLPSGTTTATATGLEATTSYDVYVQADCDADGLSLLSSPETFTTSVTPPSCGGKFYDSGGPDNDFMNDENETITILPDNPSDVVTAEFVFVDTGSPGFDELTVDIGDGNQQIVPNIADGEPPVTYRSIAADGSLVFNFISTGVVTNPGWDANITCAAPPTCLEPTDFTVTATTDSTADFSWNEVTNASNGYILSVFNAGDDPDTAMAVYTENIPAGTLTATATGLSSDSPYDAYIMADCDADGISLDTTVNFSTMIEPPACNGTFVDSGGSDGGYQANELITTTIMPDNAGDAVTITFTYVDIEVAATTAGEQDGCFDFMTIYNGPDTTFPVLAQTLCGEESGDEGVPSVATSLLSIGDSFTSTDPSGALTIVFTSDGSVQETGWSADVTCASLSVDDLQLNSFTYYPNPTNGILNISAKTAIESVEIFNILGQRVFSAKPNVQNTTVDLSSFNQGNYFLKAIIDGNTVTKKIVKE